MLEKIQINTIAYMLLVVMQTDGNTLENHLLFQLCITFCVVEHLHTLGPIIFSIFPKNSSTSTSR